MVGNSFATKRNSSRNRKCIYEKNVKEPQNMELRRSKRVAAKRVTIPIGFFSSGLKSTSTRNNNKTDFGHGRLVLSEDLHALLNNFNATPKSSSSFDEEGNERFGRANSDVVFPAGILPEKKLVGRQKTYADIADYFREVSTKNPTPKAAKQDGEVRFSNEENEVGLCSLWGVSPKRAEIRGESQSIYERKLTQNKDLTPINISFCANLLLDINPSRSNSKKSYLLKVRQTTQSFNEILDGKSPSLPLLTSKMSTKRSLPDDYDDNNLAASAAVALVPQSQWVYSTPDKCGMKKFVFEDRNKEKMVPAVIQTTKKNKVLYDIKNELIQNVNLNRFVKDDAVPIDKRFLNPIYQEDISVKRVKLDEKENFFNFKEPLSKKVSDFNVFLSNNEEKTIDIEAPSSSPMDISLPLSEESFDMNLLVEDPYEKAPIDYQHQLLLATQRPSKTTKKIPKRHMLKAKSLSFEATPPRGRPLGFEPKKLECLDEFEAQFNRLGEKNDNKDEKSDNNKAEINIANFVVPAFKFYPRINYDCNK
ncbi:uncharacterized protein [Onthophagus taurus]|uniref:uncharacterized protein n=1 Tax=Onthophagus taurus TaxID=166361 RepID=UPI000C204B36|nr:uncharacterized protein LOC111418662 [Onthophagus taurus]XP_022907052.1 uncharacterized protein LOC111418662 [Onthophagus taurus]XP_022907053.1 uncharacterized protein LOC111418662 [Onthophagus taurus]